MRLEMQLTYNYQNLLFQFGQVVAGPVLLCTTNNGICVGLTDGLFKNLTQDKIVCPTANKATAVIKDNTYICLL